jgi:hypothetical protein
VTAESRVRRPAEAAPAGTADAAPAAPGRSAGWWVAVGLLIGLPLLAFGLPALLGHPVIPGDDGSQNYPLRYLVGEQLRHGHLPLYDPYLWSGAPLLAGWNAGAAYPLTWLFAVLPGTAAWTAGLVVTWWVAGLGLFAFLRANRLAVLPALLGALSYAAMGAVGAQLPHFGLEAGASWVPLELLAVHRLTDDRRSVPGWTALLAAAFGLTILAGDPRAVDVAAATLLPYAVWRVARRRGGRATPAVAVVAGLVLGVGLSAVQLLPGLAAVSTSQRGSGGLTVYTSGSLPPAWLLLLLVPDLLGGSGSFNQPQFFASYNLTEVTSYLGLLPVVGAFGLLSRLRLRRPLPDWLIWHLVAVIGVILALGSHTPAWHLLARIPLSGSERLQSRDLMVVDLALAVLFGFWADGWLADRQGAPRGRRWPAAAAAGVPAVVALATAGTALAWTGPVMRWLGVSRYAAAGWHRLGPWLVPWIVLPVVILAALWLGPRLRATVRQPLLAALVVCDLVLCTLLVTVDASSGVGGSEPSPNAVSSGGVSSGPDLLADAGLTGRFALYDPSLVGGHELKEVGEPDRNVVAGFPSVQGYGSIVDARYAVGTGSHQATGAGQDVLSPRAVANGTLDELETSLLATPSQYLRTIAGHGPRPGPGSGRRTLTRTTPAVWYLGTPVAVGAAAVLPPPGAGAETVQLGLQLPGGRERWLPTTAGRARAPAPILAVALLARARSGSVRIELATVTVGAVTYRLDGQLADALVPPHWRYAGSDGVFALFRDSRAAPALTVRPLPGRSIGQASVQPLAGPRYAPTSAAVTSAAGVEVVRAVADIPGWTAAWQPRGAARPTVLPVHRHGLVQAVDVPAGSGTVSWRYRAPDWLTGALVSAGALLIVLALAALAGVRRRAGPVEQHH